MQKKESRVIRGVMPFAPNTASERFFRGIVHHMWSKRILAAILMVSWAAWAGNTVGYAQATGYFKKDSRPTLYQPLNLLDARDITAWCTETADPLNDVLTFGFNSPVTIDELKINNGNNFSEEVWKSFARAKKVTLKSGKESRVLNVEDKRGSQSFSVSPPLKEIGRAHV